jgi:flagellin-like protein
MNRNKSGISPVMATVILVAIAIVIAIAVAFWASGLVGVFTRFEKLEITSAYYVKGEGVKLTVKNTGSADASIDNIFVNGRPCDTGLRRRS